MSSLSEEQKRLLVQIGGPEFVRSVERVMSLPRGKTAALVACPLTTEQLSFLEGRSAGLQQYARVMLGEGRTLHMEEVLPVLVDHWAAQTRRKA